MAEHLLLTELRSVVNTSLRFLTNQTYSRNHKFSYLYEFVRGDQTIELGSGRITKDYFAVRLILVDKTESFIGERVVLLECFYPVEPGVSVPKLEEQGLRELLQNGLASLINNTYALYMRRKDEEAAEAKDVKINEAQEVTEELIKKEGKIIIP